MTWQETDRMGTRQLCLSSVEQRTCPPIVPALHYYMYDSMLKR